jgi:hypothetical protein
MINFVIDSLSKWRYSLTAPQGMDGKFFENSTSQLVRQQSAKSKTKRQEMGFDWLVTSLYLPY